jgi:1-acyl-sn-glycerol-3-phosphate acyltransferase
MNCLRLVSGLFAAALFLLIFGPARRFAQASGWRVGRTLPVAFHRLLCFTLDARLRRHGTPSLAARRLIVANHVSWLDIPLLGAIEPMTFLAKKEVGGSFLGRQVALLQGVVFVDRQRKRSIPEVNADMVRALRAREPVLLFAEATTGDGNRLLRFRSSHFEAIRRARADCWSGSGDSVVQPVFLHYSGIAGLPVARTDRPIVAWYGEMTFLPHLWRLLRAGGVICEVFYGDPIPILASSDRKALSRATERAVRRLAERARARNRCATSAIPAEPETG